MRYVIGRNIGIGFAMGIDDEEPKVEKSMENLLSPDSVAQYGAQLRTAVQDQSSGIGNAAASMASSQASAMSTDMPTARDIARAIWDEAPDIDIDLDGEKVGSMIEPRVSRIQGQKTTIMNRRAGLAAI